MGYTLFVGSPRQADDIKQLAEIRRECTKHDMPLIVWAYPRGSAIEKKGGIDTLYAVDYAAREAQELGADVIKINFPQPVNDLCPQKYKDLTSDWNLAKRVEKVINSAGRSFVIFSGGKEIEEKELLNRVETAMKQGGTGVIFGRNLWQRPFKEALKLADKIQKIIKKHS